MRIILTAIAILLIAGTIHNVMSLRNQNAEADIVTVEPVISEQAPPPDEYRLTPEQMIDLSRLRP